MSIYAMICRWMVLLLMPFLVISCGTLLHQQSPYVVLKNGVDSHESLKSPYPNSDIRIDEKINDDFLLALEYLREQRLEQAKEILLSIHKQHGELSGPVVNLGIIFEKQEINEQAEYYFNKAIEINSLNVAAYNRYALHLRERGRFDEAEKQYNKALDVSNSDIDTHRNLAFLYELYMGRFEDALVHYRQYLVLLKANSELLGIARGGNTSDANEGEKSGLKNTNLEIDKKIHVANNWIIDLERRANRGKVQ